MRIAITADLHWGHKRGDRATLALRDHLLRHPPDLFLLGGDVGTADFFGDCLRLFGDLSCPKALVPGNHDLWVGEDDERGDSLEVYERFLPEECRRHGWQYLDQGPMLVAEENLAVTGTINWYDHSWSRDALRAMTPDWEERLRTMTFTRGRHNDRRFVRWPLDDAGFTRRVVAAFEKQLLAAFEEVEKVLVLTHHPAAWALNFPPRDDGPPTLDRLLWDAFSGNTEMADLLERHADRLAGVFSGHTHRARTGTVGVAPAWNIGGDYHFKRLLVLDWPSGTVESLEFGLPNT